MRFGREEDHDLFYGSETGEYIVVKHISNVSGPHVWFDDKVYAAEEYVRHHPELAEVVESLIAAHKERGGAKEVPP